MQYWINFKGVQSGPVDAEALKQMVLTADAYVWHEGLAEWKKITEVPELEGLYATVAEGAVPTENMQPEVAVEQPRQEPATVQEQPYVPQQPIEQEPCPPTNFVWAILATVLCCVPLGIIGIVYAQKVTRLYTAGDLQGAKEASDTGAWWIIAAIVLGMMWRPLLLSMSLGG